MDISQLFRKKDVRQVIRESQMESSQPSLSRTLSVRDLTAFGIAAIIGAGIFSAIGNASHAGGPAVVFLFIFTAVACAFSGLAYAEFSSMVPVSGSAYTYSYTAFGELIAWIIGWDLLIEYAIGNIAVAISWSDYFTSLLHGLKIDIPSYFTMDYLSASRGYQEGLNLIAAGTPVSSFSDSLAEKYSAWLSAPQILGFHVIADIPALMITAFITWLVYIGIKESKQAGNLMVLVKLIVIIMVITVGAFYVDTKNWSPFAPNGIKGIMQGVSAVFFAFVGFDAISTTAEECKNPQRDLPRSIIYSLIICTVLYVGIALVLTGMVNYKDLAVGDPLSYAFEKVNIGWLSGVIAISAVFAMTSVLLVFQMGQPRIWMSMSRDGLLPALFSSIHPKYKTPWFSTLITGFMVAIPALFMNLTEVTDLTSIGTLFAFMLVSAGVLKIHAMPDPPERKFKTPYVNAKYIAPLMFVLVVFLVAYFIPGWFSEVFMMKGGWDVLKHNLPIQSFFIVFAYMSVQAYRKNYSLIPLMGVLSCLYLMTELGIKNWERFFYWLLLGLVIYFAYSYRNSNLNTKKMNARLNK